MIQPQHDDGADDGDDGLANIACWAVRHPAAPFAGMTQTGSMGVISAASLRHPRPSLMMGISGPWHKSIEGRAGGEVMVLAGLMPSPAVIETVANLDKCELATDHRCARRDMLGRRPRAKPRSHAWHEIALSTKSLLR